MAVSISTLRLEGPEDLCVRVSIRAYSKRFKGVLTLYDSDEQAPVVPVRR
jgi:hypothetical protein